MRLIAIIFLLCLCMPLTVHANALAPKTQQLSFKPDSFEIVITGLKPNEQKFGIKIQFKQFNCRFSLSEILIYQFLSLALIVSFFHLTINN